MGNTRYWMGWVTVLLLGGALPGAWGETPLAAFGVQAQVSFSPDPILPAELGVNARFVPADGVGNLGGEALRLTFMPPSPCYPPDPVYPPTPCEPDWALTLPAGCFEALRGGGWKLNEASCPATLKRTASDGVVYDLTDYLRGVKGKIAPPTDTDLAYVMKLKVSFALDNGSTIPPSPCLGRTELVIGDPATGAEVGEAQNSACSWEGTQALPQ
jgi:hypothetical protein